MISLVRRMDNDVQSALKLFGIERGIMVINLFVSLVTLGFPLIVLAQDSIRPDMITGGAGWVGAGLLGLVLSWLLLVRLPANDRTIKELIDSRDKIFLQVSEDHRKSFNAMESDHRKSFLEAERQRREDYLTSLKVVTDHCQKEAEQARDVIRREIDEVGRSTMDVRQSLEELREAFLLATGDPLRNRVKNPLSLPNINSDPNQKG